ncbi:MULTISPECIES: hypothetical protein [Chryseobacterium]|uniref:Uncharacterized protein n=1 Tax=Chryseobacterium gambrini TaxID=373672 RepID=A0A1N7QZE8_9FLAO|nr:MULTISPECIES: hypothetical protein [Chryseobacterium]MCQ4138963.1 hypothetical protein [Chryseobacterium sp. EO14]SIT28253.1 hypothetical protein SAMN05421785_1266 [Chryseobacterium gambrini]
MTLYYIHLGLDYNDYILNDNELRFEFQKHTNFIDDYFSKAVRKHRFITDGTFKMIAVSPTEFGIKPNKIVPTDVLEVNIPFDRKRYEEVKGSEDFNYYLELLEQGFRKASNSKEIPLDILLNLITEFKEGGCRNEWLHKKKQFKKNDLEVKLICEFTTNYFQLKVSISQISTKKELINGIIAQTEPGNSIHEGLFKDIIIDKDIIITDKADAPRFEISINKALEGKLEYKIFGDKDVKKILSYHLS